jgi:hypothetical protein
VPEPALFQPAERIGTRLRNAHWRGTRSLPLTYARKERTHGPVPFYYSGKMWPAHPTVNGSVQSLQRFSLNCQLQAAKPQQCTAKRVCNAQFETHQRGGGLTVPAALARRVTRSAHLIL